MRQPIYRTGYSGKPVIETIREALTAFARDIFGVLKCATRC
jgi:hypothetical protein